MPTPSLVMMADDAAGTLNSSAAYLTTAVKGAFSGTLTLWVFAVCRVRCGGNIGVKDASSQSDDARAFGCRLHGVQRLWHGTENAHPKRQLRIRREDNLELDFVA
jgi:hypothetical protein